MKNYILPVLATSVILAACASDPNKMSATYVSPNQYSDYDCKQIRHEQSRIMRRSDELYSQLRKDADNDALQMGIGIVLFWPALFFLEGSDGPQAVEYSRLKGEYEALEKVSTQKRCGLHFQSLVPTAASVKKREEPTYNGK